MAQACNVISGEQISTPVENDASLTVPYEAEQGVAVTDNCYAGQWPLHQLVHSACHHVLSAQRSGAA